MELYDTMIRRILEYVEQAEEKDRPDPSLKNQGGLTCHVKKYPYHPGSSWPVNDDYECIFQKDTGVLLGGSGRMGCNILCVTTDPSLIPADETILIGPDLLELQKQNSPKSGAVPFVRITLIYTGEIAEGKDYRTLQDMDFVKYNIFPRGYMVRASGQSQAEQVRVSKKALHEGISFRQIGNTYLNAYKKNPRVEKAAVLFLTDPALDYTELNNLSLQAEKIRKSLSVIMKGIATDCKSCSIREVCNEIEGLRQAHFEYRTENR